METVYGKDGYLKKSYLKMVHRKTNGSGTKCKHGHTHRTTNAAWACENK